MKIKTVKAYYFSPTNTTRTVCEQIASTAAAGLRAAYASDSFDLPGSRKKDVCFGPDELAVIGVPVYAGRVPNLILPYIRDHIKGAQTPAVAVVLYGNRDFDDALIELRNVLCENGIVPIAAGAFVGEHSFSDTLAAGRPDKRDLEEAVKLAERAVIRVKNLIRRDDGSLYGHDIDLPVRVRGNDPPGPYYTPRDRQGQPINILKVKPVTDPDKCTRCGRCARLCPMGAIDPEDVTQVPGTCIKCCACVKQCPSGAKYFDDEGFLYHKSELEAMYGGRRAKVRLY